MSSESTPFLSRDTPSVGISNSDGSKEQIHVGSSRKQFFYESVAFILAVTVILAIGVVLFIKYRLWEPRGFAILIPIISVLVWLLLDAYVLLTMKGLTLWKQGDLPLQKDPEACYIMVGKRTIEYYVWGSDKPDATVAVLCHGSCNTGKGLNGFLYPSAALKELNVKAISPSYPGHGGSDTQPYRKISEWPLDDLSHILEKEKVDKFMVQGSSYGTAHAMATAACFPERCLAMGLNVPYLPKPICRELELWTDADMILDANKLAMPWIILPIMALLDLFNDYLCHGCSMYKEGVKIQQDAPDLVEALVSDAKRSFLRGVWGQTFEMFNADVSQFWQDPRTIQTPNVAVWYAQDDTCCPPEHGKWLAEMFTNKLPENHVSIRSEKKELGHFTYMTKEDRENGGQVKVLIDMIQ